MEQFNKSEIKDEIVDQEDKGIVLKTVDMKACQNLRNSEASTTKKRTFTQFEETLEPRDDNFQMYETILSREDFNDFDEGRVYNSGLPLEKTISEPVKTECFNPKIVQVNHVYTSKNMGLSTFISSNKSTIDFKNFYN